MFECSSQQDISLLAFNCKKVDVFGFYLYLDIFVDWQSLCVPARVRECVYLHLLECASIFSFHPIGFDFSYKSHKMSFHFSM